jgi:integrase
VNRCVAAVLSVWRRAHRRGLLGPPPTGMYGREPKGRRRVLSPGEEVRLLDALAEPYLSLTRFLLASGLRVGEALALRWTSVSTDTEQITVEDSKNGDARVVPGVQWKYTGSGGDERGPFARVSHSAFNHAFRAAKAAIGLEKDDELVPHSLRHTYATRMVVAGVPLSVVARLLGHRTVRTTMRYSHVSDEDAARWVKKVQEGS